jgi:hypothetical protein
MSIHKVTIKYLLIIILLLMHMVSSIYVRNSVESKVVGLSGSKSNINMVITPDGNYFFTYHQNDNIYYTILKPDLTYLTSPTPAVSHTNYKVLSSQLIITNEYIYLIFVSNYNSINYNTWTKVFGFDESQAFIDTVGNNHSDFVNASLCAIGMRTIFAFSSWRNTDGPYPTIESWGVDLVNGWDGGVSIINKGDNVLIDTNLKLCTIGNNFVAIYLKNVNGSKYLFGRIFSPFYTLIHDEFQINTISGDQSNAQVLSWDSGSLFVVSWTNSIDKAIMAKRFDYNKNVQGSEYTICTPNCDKSFIGDLGSNGIIITYLKANNGVSELYYRIIDEAGQLLIEKIVTKTYAGDKNYPFVLGKNTNNLYFAYSYGNDIHFDIYRYLQCKALSYTFKQGDNEINFNNDINTSFKTQARILSLPGAGTLLNPNTLLGITAGQIFDKLIFNIRESTSISFSYSSYYDNETSDDTCQVTIISCHANCDSCSQTGSDTTMFCTTCKSGFYKKEADGTTNANMANNCYDSIPEYVLKANLFKKCYSSCTKCSDLGSFNDHFCTVCKANHHPLEDNLSNCYTSDTNLLNYRFSPDDNLFLRNNFPCYESCFNCFKKGNDANHYCTSCKQDYYPLEDTPSMCYLPQANVEGYIYSNNIFIKCYQSCDKCTQHGTSTDHQCTKCKVGYYPTEDKLTNCYTNDLIPNYYLDSNLKQFRKCYLSCGSCNGLGNDADNKCKACYNGYYMLQDKQSQCISINDSVPGYHIDTPNKRFSNCYKSCQMCQEGGSEKEHNCLLCKDGYYKTTKGDNNCFDAAANIPEFYFDNEGKLFKPCFDSCYTCSAKGDEKNHNCLKCKIDYYNLEDNKALCYTKDTKLEGYKFTTNVFKKCEGDCTPPILNQIITDIKSNDPVLFNKALDRLIEEPKRINNDLVTNIASDFTVPAQAGSETIEKLNSVLDLYVENSIHDIFRIIEGIFDLIHGTLKHSKHLTGDRLSNEVIAQLKKLYDDTKALLLKVSDQYVITNMDNLNLLVSFDHFEVEVFDYHKYTYEDRNLQESAADRSSTIEIDHCAEKIRDNLNVTTSTVLPIRKLDIKTDLMELNPYINNTKTNVTGLVSSRSLGIGAYSSLNRSKLNIDTLCEDSPMRVDFQANDFTQFNATDYGAYKRLGIDIFDKNLFKDCQSFRNNESHADFTTKHINSVTDVAIDCGAGCSYKNILTTKLVKCSCANSIGTEFNIYKQNLQFAFQKSKITIISCAGTAFTNVLIANNPGFWFVIALIIFLISIIAITFYCFDYDKLFIKVVHYNTTFKATKEEEAEAAKKAKELETHSPTASPRRRRRTDPNISLSPRKSIPTEPNDKKIEIAGTQDTEDDDHYVGTFLHVEINQGTAEFLTPSELVQFDSRSYIKYLRDIFLTRHEIGKVFFLPNIYIPKYLAIMFFIQTISVNFALNAILYDDTLIDDRNRMKDNVRLYSNSSIQSNTSYPTSLLKL